MALQLPQPASPGTLPTHSRAYKRWQTGQRHAEREQWPLAARWFEEAAGLHGDPAYGLAAAHALIKAGQSDRAARRARAIRTAEPRTAMAYALESHALIGLGRAEEAVACLRGMPADVPRDANHHVSLAVALQSCRRHEEAIPSFMDALALKLDEPTTHFRLGMSFRDMGMKAEAAECLRTAIILGLDSSDLAARGLLAFLEREACRWAGADEVMASLRRAVVALPDGAPVEVTAFAHAVLVDDPLELLKAARHYALHVALGYPPLPRRIARRHDRRLRIGYLSADFHEHATSQLMAQMLASHDRCRFEVTLLSTSADDQSAMRRRLRAGSEHFEDLHGQSFTSIAAHIRALGIDILVDLKGATYDTLMPVLAQRPAPLQVSWLGFPGTTGAPFIDYFIGDTVTTPLADAAHFSEKIAQLPHCYQPNDVHRALPQESTRAQWGLADGSLVLCAFHQSYKISAPVFDVWCDVLRELPDAVLWLLQWNAAVQTRLTAAAAERGVAPERLVFSPVLPLQAHLTRLACADLYLDAWPCNAHTTASEALWCGVPVLTLKGRTFAQRVAASVLHAAELDELVATDVDAYRDFALALARDPARRSALRTRLVGQRTTSPLFDGAAFARDVEALFERMWERAVEGEPAEHLPALARP